MVRTVRDERQLPLLLPESEWVAPYSFPDLDRYPVIGFDTETYDPGLTHELGSSWALGDGYVLGYSIAIPERSYYFPLRHPEGNHTNVEKVLEWLRYSFANYKGTVVGQNLAYDVGWSGRDGIEFKQCKLYDTMYAAAMLDEYRDSYSLDALARSYGLAPKDEALLREASNAYCVDAKAGLWRLPAKYVGPYAERDAAVVLEVREKQLPQIEADHIQGALEMEHELLPLNVLMRKQGVPVLLDRVPIVKKKMIDKENEALTALKEIAGFSVEIWSGRSIAIACQHVGLQYPTTALDQPSFQKEWLEEQKHPLTNAIRRARSYNKARRDFIEAMIEDHLGKDNRIHPELHPLRSESGGGTVGGRFSYTDPNLQQVPARDEEIGPLVRSLFGSHECSWGVFDVSQQEPRFTVHFANLLDLPGAAEAARIINENPRTDFHKMVADITNLPRSQAKPINLGKAYGMGGAKLCRKLGLPTEIWLKDGREIPVAGEEGKKIIKQYDEKFPFMKGLYEFCDRLARDRGYIKLIDGRRCRFPLYETPGFGKKGKALPYEQAVQAYGANVVRAWTRDAMNRLIQGSASVQLKRAILKIWKETGIIPYLSVHDEVDAPVTSDAQVIKINECVLTAVEITVPFLTDIEVGPSWGEAKKGKIVDGCFVRDDK